MTVRVEALVADNRVVSVLGSILVNLKLGDNTYPVRLHVLPTCAFEVSSLASNSSGTTTYPFPTLLLASPLVAPTSPYALVSPVRTRVRRMSWQARMPRTDEHSRFQRESQRCTTK